MTPCVQPPDADVTAPVLSALLCEALALTEEIALADEALRALARPDCWQSAARLRLAARLARIAAWASSAGAPEPERREAASAALSGAAPSPRLDFASAPGPEEATALRQVAARVDRLAARALRLDALLCGQDEPAAPPADSRACADPAPGARAAAILLFPSRPRLERASGQA